MNKPVVNLKTIISYYGGKQQLLPKILSVIPEHRIYSEAFFGGGAVFFGKQPCQVEIINDINKKVIGFYKVAKRQFEELQDEIDVTLYSEEQYLQAREIYLTVDENKHNDVLRAWSLFVLSQQTFLHILDNTWSFSRHKNCAVTFANKKKMFDERYVKRLENTQIFCRDALRVLKNSDDAEAFHFLDPPYYNANMGHYKGYTLEDFEGLLKTCETLKGKFLLTTYPSEILTQYQVKNGWYQIEFNMHKSASHKEGERKTEVFTMNYEPDAEVVEFLKKG